MSFYSEKVFPALNDLLTKQFVGHRYKALLSAQGKILEIGFGIGLSLPCYPSSVSQVVGVDPNPGMVAKAASRKDERAKVVAGVVEKLPFDDEAFDGVASFFTLCSVSDLKVAIGEIKRVLKPSGSLFLIEHVAHPTKSFSRKLQSIVDPMVSRLACGCVVTRETTHELTKAGFNFSELKAIGSNPLLGTVYRGIATI